MDTIALLDRLIHTEELLQVDLDLEVLNALLDILAQMVQQQFAPQEHFLPQGQLAVHLAE